MTQRSPEELIHHMGAVAEWSETEWARSFARSIQRQSRRRHWKPSPKQRAMMHKLVAELFEPRALKGDDEVIET